MDSSQIADMYPLSPMQHGMLFHGLLAPESGNYHEQTTWILEGALQEKIFAEAWQLVINRHTVLRTAVFWEGLDEPLQIVWREVNVPFENLDWCDLSEPEQEAHLADFLENDLRRGFDLAAPPLMRLRLIKTGPKRWFFVWSHHHLLLDGWSQPLIFTELVTCYQSLLDQTFALLPPAQPFMNYINWLQQQDLAEAEAFWRQELQGITAPTPLVVDRKGSAAGEPAVQKALVPQDVTAVLQSIAQQNKITLNTILQGVWALLLSRYNDTDNVLFGATVSGRPPELPDVESMVGLFINTLPVRIRVSQTDTVMAWLQSLHAQQQTLHQFEHVLLTDIQGWSEVPRDLPLFESLFVFESYPTEAVTEQLDKAGLRITQRTSYSRTNFPLTLAVTPGTQLGLMVSYDNGRFTEQTIQNLVGHLQTILAGIAANPHQHVAALPLLTELEQQQIMVDWNETEVDFPVDKTVTQLFEEQVERTPTATAVVFGEQKLTFAALNRRANQLAHWLQKQGVGPEIVVGLSVEPSLEMIIGILGILKAGGAYLPLDPDYPADRLTFMLTDAWPSLVLTQQSRQPLVTPNAIPTLALDTEWPMVAQEPTINSASAGTADSLAYIIYTSGSTGQPKGTLLAHCGLVNFAHAFAQDMVIGPGSRVLQFASISFDASVAEIFTTLLAGATLCLAPRETMASIPDLTNLLQGQAITSVTLPPAVWELLDPDMLPDLHTAVSAGEALPPQVAQRWAPRCRFFNAYGPTETTIGAAWYQVPSEVGHEPVPIGKPIANTQLYILDHQGRPVPVGVPGELCIGGMGLARDYLNRPELTAERFIQLAVNGEHFTNYRLPTTVYRTGDRCRFLADGNIAFLGRLDQQVKVRGFRIELGEIEAVLKQHEHVRETAVLAQEDSQAQKQLVAYLVIEGEPVPTTNELHDFLAQRLPKYMIPAVYVLLETMPHLPNGKVDRPSLLMLDGDRLAPSTVFQPPNTPEEEILAGMWQQVLDVEKVGIDDNFFALGGHSLNATQLVSRIRETFAVDLPLRRFFDAPTIRGIAKAIQTSSRETVPAIVPIARDGDLQLSFAQQRLWFLDQLAPGAIFYNIPMAIRLTGRLNTAVLKKCLKKIVRRHEALHTIFTESDGRPMQHILPKLKLKLHRTDLRHLPLTKREDEAQRLALEEAKRPFDLAHGPLIRASLLRLADEEFVVLLTMHHIISDGWSLGVLTKELGALYAALVTDEPSPLPALPIQYADFSQWQREWLQGIALESQLAYWKTQLGQNPPMLDLPTDRPRPAVQTANGATKSFSLSPTLSQSLKALSQQRGATLFMTLLAAFQTLLYRYTGQTDISVGTAVANRNRAEIEGLIGFFVNTLVLRTDLSGAPEFEDLLARVREVALGAYAHQDLPFEMLVEALQPERDLSHTPLFQVMFVLDNAPMEPVALPSLVLQPVATGSSTATFDLTLSMSDGAEGLRGYVEYNLDLFEAETIQRLAGHYQSLLAGIVAQPEQPISQLPILTPAEEQQLLVEWNETAVPYPDNQCIHHLIEAQAAQHPEASAVSFGETQLSYSQLNRRANQLAHHLQQQGVGPESIVGIATERSLAMVIAILGVLKAGGAYLPLDPSYPAERLAFMIADAQLTILLSQSHLLTQLPTSQAPDQPPLPTICLDMDWPQIAQEPEHNPIAAISADNLAYIIYTSGSTGQPKGTLLRHRGLCNLSAAQRRAFNIQPNHSRILQFSSLSFDASVWETFMALANGATLILARQETLSSAPELLHLLHEQQITNVTLPPSVLALLPTEPLPALETIIAAGEACPAELVQHWAPGRAFFNAYGPTETTVCAAMYRCDPAEADNPPIGRPLDNFQFYVLDGNQQPVPVGVPGELCVAGVGLARGYHNRPELTAAKFIDLRLDTPAHRQSKIDNPKLYKTGDLVRYRADGNLEFLGRLDHQVKVRGFRIELAEVESVLRQHEAIHEAVVVAQGQEADKRLVAYIMLTQETAPTLPELRAYLRQRLPEYMVPGQFVTLKTLPLTPSGKIDRQALPAPDKRRPELEKAYVAPRSETEATLVQLWCELLEVEQVGIYDNFFELGGHSLLATQLMSRLRHVFEVEMPLRRLFEDPTVAELALAVETMQASIQQPQAPAIVPLSRSERRQKRHAIGGNGRTTGTKKENASQGIQPDKTTIEAKKSSDGY